MSQPTLGQFVKASLEVQSDGFIVLKQLNGQNFVFSVIFSTLVFFLLRISLMTSGL